MTDADADSEDPRPEGHYPRFADNEWHHVHDELAQTISLGPAGDGEDGPDWILTYTPERRNEDDREKTCERWSLLPCRGPCPLVEDCQLGEDFPLTRNRHPQTSIPPRAGSLRKGGAFALHRDQLGDSMSDHAGSGFELLTNSNP